jgi:ribosome-binding factor A
LIDPEFLEALCEDNSSHSSADRQAERKAQQFCRQVQRALNLALADRVTSDGLAELFVEEVVPAPDCGHLLAYVAVPAGSPVKDVMAALRRQSPGLRLEVGSAISRKRAPELYFIPACAEGGGDE